MSILDLVVSLISLSAMEIVLGIDNVVFLAILVSKIPPAQREPIRRTGLALALVARVGLLSTLSWLMGLTRPLITLSGHGFSARDLILLGGGLFLIGKSAKEIHDKVERDEDEFEGPDERPPASSFVSLVIQIIIVDLIFSIDSVVTAVGMAQNLYVMIAAMFVAVTVMYFFSRAVGEFVENHPSVKLLALSFLLLIGVMLMGEGLGQHIPKGYIYFSMAFSLGVELLSMRYSNRRKRRAASMSDRSSMTG